MNISRRFLFHSKRTIITGILISVTSFLLTPNSALSESAAKSEIKALPRMTVVMPVINSQRGRRLFVTKGCFICHSIQGVGGKAAPVLDAKPSSREIDVLGFVARMWKGAPLMYELQSMELGYRIELTRDEIIDLAGFVEDANAQEGFNRTEIPEVVQEWMVNEAWWKDPSIKPGDLLPDNFPDLENKGPSGR